MSQENNSVNVGNGDALVGGSGENNSVDQAGSGDKTVNGGAPDNKGAIQKNKRMNRNRRQKMYNNVQSLFSNAYQSYDLRNMLGPSGAWYHQPQRTHFKKPRTNNNKQTPNKKNDKADGPIEDIMNPLKCAIVHENYPGTLFSEDEFYQIQSKLTNMMLEAQESLKFHSCLLRHGAVIIHCYDETSKNWILKDDINCGINLKVGLVKDLILTANVTFTIPKLLNLDNDQIMKLLKCQNNGLRTELWQVLETKSDETDNIITAAIDEASFKAIKAESYQAYLGLGMIKFSNSQYYNVVTYNSAS